METKGLETKPLRERFRIPLQNLHPPHPIQNVPNRLRIGGFQAL
ncbi:MAG: hypothetical protein RIB93_14975 [Coleofasciculus sp. D1-CHI-01]